MDPYVFSVPRATNRVARQRRSRGRGSRRGAHGHAERGRPTRRAEGDGTAQGPCHPAKYVHGPTRFVGAAASVCRRPRGCGAPTLQLVPGRGGRGMPRPYDRRHAGAAARVRSTHPTRTRGGMPGRPRGCGAPTLQLNRGRLYLRGVATVSVVGPAFQVALTVPEGVWASVGPVAVGGSSGRRSSAAAARTVSGPPRKSNRLVSPW